jgi:predicted Fe-S protein YdhL (DUF1289 family)
MAGTTLEAQVASPCTGVCQLDAQQVCIGCGRTAGEITVWRYADDGLRREICRVASLRRAGFVPARRR